MKYGKVVDGEITNWLDINPLNALKIQKATAKGYLLLVDAEKPIYDLATQRVVEAGLTIGADSIIRNWTVEALSAEEIQRIADVAQRVADIEAMLPTWEQAVTAVKNAFPDPAQQNIVLKMAKLLAWLCGIRPISS